MRFVDYGAHCGTGGVQSRAFVFLACWMDNRLRGLNESTDRSGIFSSVVCMGGPLDAPDTMPAGACNSSTFYSAYHDDAPGVSTFTR
jgi:hypothetical protein